MIESVCLQPYPEKWIQMATEVVDEFRERLFFVLSCVANQYLYYLASNLWEYGTVRKLINRNRIVSFI